MFLITENDQNDHTCPRDLHFTNKCLVQVVRGMLMMEIAVDQLYCSDDF